MDIKIDIKTLITLLTIAATLGGFYYSTQSRIDDLEKEIGDLLCMVGLLEQYGLIDIHSIEKHINSKAKKLIKYSNLQEFEL